MQLSSEQTCIVWVNLCSLASPKIVSELVCDWYPFLQVSMGMPSTVSATLPGGALGPVDVASEFLSCVNAYALSRSQVASMLERASDSARRALVIAGLPPGTLPPSAVAQALPALKPMVRALLSCFHTFNNLPLSDGGCFDHRQSSLSSPIDLSLIHI